MPVDEGHWVRTLRDVKADSVHAFVGEERFGTEHEKFIYYDGLLPRGDWVRPANGHGPPSGPWGSPRERSRRPSGTRRSGWPSAPPSRSTR